LSAFVNPAKPDIYMSVQGNEDDIIDMSPAKPDKYIANK